jgi:hypothetical protein
VSSGTHSVRGLVNPKVIVQLEGLSKKEKISSGLQPVTFLLVA